ncbi:MAG: MarR family transcriptional regulator [Paracoccaceae bacterium]|jgi:DNA-binding MarR family transcriptional regulator|nr:MarR family transcriptional regulator [Paracoccaceae bacterium]MDG1373205.1 MarR family transcriptional regulator [Paracoccaceae bacterium]MDG1971078.1 MarR family transcriptional regulator [Paracoccaceae bacterium]
MSDETRPRDYQLNAQVGFNLRRANQRHVAIFQKHVDGLTPTQFAAMARVHELGPISQNRLGRLTAMDSATIKGVVERLLAKSLVALNPDPDDKRLRLVSLTAEGEALIGAATEQALAARMDTLAPLSEAEAVQLEALLAKLV